MRVGSKWILAGEHSVTRGVPAIAFPCNDHYMCIRDEVANSLIIDGNPMLGPIIEKYIGRKIRYRLSFESTIPVGAGFGSSAALSVLIAKWMKDRKYCDDDLLLALHIEDSIHGKSSGIDVLAIYHNKQIHYLGTGIYEFLEMNWTPDIRGYVTPSEKTTKKSVHAVKKYIEKNGNESDTRMRQAVKLCESGLKMHSIEPLKEGIQLADSCFIEWGLYTDEMKAMKERLLAEGAIAVKPTGAGNGGGMIALFPDES